MSRDTMTGRHPLTPRPAWDGLALHVNPALPIYPSPGEQARRIVRHGLADVLAWLGEDVGPAPDEATHMLEADGVLYVSAEAMRRLADRYADAAEDQVRRLLDTSLHNDMTRHSPMT